MADQITIERSLIERTIESLENWLPYYLRSRGYPVLVELRAALAAPAQPGVWPGSVTDAVLNTPEPDKWVDVGGVRLVPMFHMNTIMRYGEKCAEAAMSFITHDVKDTPAQPNPSNSGELEAQPTAPEKSCGNCKHKLHPEEFGISCMACAQFYPDEWEPRT